MIPLQLPEAPDHHQDHPAPLAPPTQPEQDPPQELPERARPLDSPGFMDPLQPEPIHWDQTHPPTLSLELDVSYAELDFRYVRMYAFALYAYAFKWNIN